MQCHLNQILVSALANLGCEVGVSSFPLRLQPGWPAALITHSSDRSSTPSDGLQALESHPGATRRRTCGRDLMFNSPIAFQAFEANCRRHVTITTAAVV